MLLTVPDLENLRGSALSEFDRRTAAIPPEQDEVFTREVARLEGQLETIYRMAVLVQRREPDMDAALAVWEALVQSATLSCSSWRPRDHPACAPSYDKMLDLRLAAEK